MNLLKRLFNKLCDLHENTKIAILVITAFVIFVIVISGLVEQSRKEHRLYWCYEEFDTPRCHVELEKRKEAAYLKETSAK